VTKCYTIHTTSSMKNWYYFQWSHYTFIRGYGIYYFNKLLDMSWRAVVDNICFLVLFRKSSTSKYYHTTSHKYYINNKISPKILDYNNQERLNHIMSYRGTNCHYQYYYILLYHLQLIVVKCLHYINGDFMWSFLQLTIKLIIIV